MVGSGSCVWPWEENNRRAVEKRHTYDGGLQGTAHQCAIYPNIPYFCVSWVCFLRSSFMFQVTRRECVLLMLFKKGVGGKMAGPWVMRATCWL